MPVSERTLRCRRCGGTVSLPPHEQLVAFAALGAAVRCDECGTELGSARRALEYLTQRDAARMSVDIATL